jgi:hypothetical protein
MDLEATASVIRITGDNFRLSGRLLIQVEPVVEINKLRLVSKPIVEEPGKT